MPNQKGLYAGLIAILGWGMAGMFIKLMPSISPIWVSAVRSLIAVIVLLGYVWMRPSLRKGLRKINTKLNWELGFYTAAFYFFAVIAYQLASVAEAALVLSTTPLFILAWGIIRGVPVSKNETLGALVAAGGVLLIFLPRLGFDESQKETQLWGLLAALIGCLIIALFVMRLRHLEMMHRRPDIWGINILAFLILSLPLVIGIFSEREMIAIQQSWEGDAKYVSLALGIFSTALPGVGFAYASTKLPPIITTSLRFLTPVVATILAAIFLKEIPGGNIYFGGLLVLFGLLWMTLNPFGKKL